MAETNTPGETELRDRIAEAIDAAWTECGDFGTDVAVDAVMAVVAGEAIDRMAEAFVAESRLRAMDFRNGMKMDIIPAREIAAAWVAAARAMLGDAPNYAETPVEMETGLAGERERFAFTLQRVGNVTPHQARQAAEAERDTLAATINRIREIPRLPHASEQEGTLGRAYTRGWESVIELIDAALADPARGGDSRG